MDRDEFTNALALEGFEEIVTVEREPNGFLDVHAHPFEAKALVFDGEIHLRIGPTKQIFQAGQVFHLRANEAHAESYGNHGVKYLVGRK